MDTIIDDVGEYTSVPLISDTPYVFQLFAVYQNLTGQPVSVNGVTDLG